MDEPQRIQHYLDLLMKRVEFMENEIASLQRGQDRLERLTTSSLSTVASTNTELPESQTVDVGRRHHRRSCEDIAERARFVA